MATPADKQLILNDKEIRSKIDRMAYEIYESNFGQKKLFVAGIGKRGGHLAELLRNKLKEISPLDIIGFRIDKLGEKGQVALDAELDMKGLKGKHVVLVDDVLYSGITMFNAVAALLPFRPGRIQNALLVDRGHRSLPIRPDIVGVSLATTLKQHVSVEISPKGKLSTFLE